MTKKLPTHILYISDSTTFGGSERYLVDVITHFNKLTRVELLFIGSGCPEMEEMLVKESVVIHHLPNRGKLGLYVSIWKFLIKYRGWLIHANLTYYDACQGVPIALFFLPLARCIATIHGLVPKPQLNRLQKLKRQLRERLFNRYNLVMSPSAYVAHEIVANWGVDEHRVQVVHNGVSAVKVKTKDEAINKQLRILYLGRLSTEKGLMYLIAALQELNPKLYHCYLVGDGPNRQEISDLVDQHGLAETISFEGFHTNTQPYLSKADILVLPSLYENFPLVILEAMSCGLPTVASRVGGIPEQIIDGETGILVPAKDPTAIARAIQSLLDDRESLKQMGAAAQGRFDANFTLEIMLDNIADCYQQVTA